MIIRLIKDWGIIHIFHGKRVLVLHNTNWATHNTNTMGVSNGGSTLFLSPELWVRFLGTKLQLLKLMSLNTLRKGADASTWGGYIIRKTGKLPTKN